MNDFFHLLILLDMWLFKLFQAQCHHFETGIKKSVKSDCIEVVNDLKISLNV